ncbi:GNAT family N-acetyltransferase [Paramicrobacterium agarici]|uniref:RimJ/RimL family protein N-acetyltransferase n=1 Tax=Paramicrobacterium agarici TaxID=630514 RepID=A0A2A9DZS0_9MICO|nr:GNAT family N-acetyltransferase [Microbacterium agarici]PFG31420.1 RimJ/RimL family protein N-acetyltransferase [Microbacterium agarici]
MPQPHRERTRAAYDRVAADYAELLATELVARPLHRHLLDDFASRVVGPALDAGCGPGRVAAYLDSRGVDVSGVDLSPGMIDEARRRHPHISFRVGTLDQLGVADASLGGIVAWYSIIHTPEHELPAIAGEFRRALSPDGILLLGFQAGSSQTVSITSAYGHDDLDYEAVRHSPDAVVAALEAAGFAVELHAVNAATPPERDPQAYITARVSRERATAYRDDRLTTERLLLRCPTLHDVDAITAACQDPELQRRVPVPVPYRREHAVAYVTTYCEDGWLTGERCTWALDAGGSFAGVVGLDRIADGSANLGFWMAPGHRGRGYLTEAIAAVIDYAFAYLQLERVEWRAFAGNVGSARAAQRAGFHFEGVRRSASVGREGREDDWVGSILAADDRSPQPWSVLN